MPRRARAPSARARRARSRPRRRRSATRRRREAGSSPCDSLYQGVRQPFPLRAQQERQRRLELDLGERHAAVRDERDAAGRARRSTARAARGRSLPADARTARGPSGSAHSGDSETAAPNASAVRTSVPTFPGSVTRQSASVTSRVPTGRSSRRKTPTRAARARASRPRRGAPARRSRRRRAARPARSTRRAQPRPGPRSRPRTAPSPPGACARREASGRAGASRSGATRSGARLRRQPSRTRAPPSPCSATTANASGSDTAMSASDLRSSSMPGEPHAGHEAVVREAVHARGRVDAHDPERAERPLLDPPVAVRVDERALDLLLRVACSSTS